MDTHLSERRISTLSELWDLSGRVHDGSIMHGEILPGTTINYCGVFVLAAQWSLGTRTVHVKSATQK